MRQAKENEAIDLSDAVIPDDEPPEDSELRRDMLRYSESRIGMTEMGPIVAELELDEGDSNDDDDEWEVSGDEDEDEVNEVDDDDEDEDADGLGRSKHSVITGGYIKRMQALEKRLGVQSAFTVHRQPPPASPQVPDAGIGRIVVKSQSLPAGDAEPAKAPFTEGKSVRFAPQLDISEETTAHASMPPKLKETFVSSISDAVERNIVPEAQSADAEVPKRVSRFKKERAGVAKPVATPTLALPRGPHQMPTKYLDESRSESPPPPAAPEGRTLANTVLERNISSEVKEPDDMDDVLVYQAASVEYNRLRNQIIQKAGGFMREEEQEIVSLDQNDGSKPMSRFKAARLTKP
jgi:unconventional prefoldin RPB5 interactor 1